MSLTTARAADPAGPVLAALDELVRAVAAERAYLFAEAPAEAPVGAAEAPAGASADVPAAGSALVEQVRLTRAPLVATGTADGAGPGSGRLAQGLHSILVAPVEREGRLLGVLYLDSPIASGAFTAADVGVLATLTAQVAAALEACGAARPRLVRQNRRPGGGQDGPRTGGQNSTVAKVPTCRKPTLS